MKMKFKFIILFFIIIFIRSYVFPAGNYDYYYISFSKLKLASGSFPVFVKSSKIRSNWKERAKLRKIAPYIKPYAVEKNRAEIYIKNSEKWFPDPLKLNIKHLYLAIRIKRGIKPTGSIFFIDKSFKKMNKVEFKVSRLEADQKNIKKKFYKIKEKYYRELLNMGIPGTAWFRYNITKTKHILSGSKMILNGSRRRNRTIRRRSQTKLQTTYSLFSGDRALSENLQLNRTLSIVAPEKPTIQISSIKGITVSEFNWKDHIYNIDPEKDRLSKYIPFDQYAVFFKSFNSMTSIINEMEIRGTPVLKMTEPRSEEMYSKKKYQKQLCLPTNMLSKILGPSVISSVAFTGSDPYLRTGTDISILFNTKNINLVKSTIKFHYKNSIRKNNKCKKVKGKIKNFLFEGVKTPDRSISSYMLILNNKTLIITNSLVQLKRIIKTYNKKTKSIYTLDEYTYFRDRYKKGNPEESALVIISDAFIRKICSPKWRIADSRRMRTLAVLSELTAEYIDRVHTLNKTEEKWLDVKIIPGIGKLKITDKGITSSKYGNLEFLTPISELNIDKITDAEKKSYIRFRDNYQNNWRKYFDPIAIRFYINKKRLSVDTTIKPLIKESEYRGLMEITKNSAIEKNSGDIHPGSLLHYIMSLDPNSKTMKKFGNFAMSFAPKLGNTAFNWIGNWFSFYIDKTEFWKDLKIYSTNKPSGISDFFKNNINRFPAAIAVDVNNSLKLTLFLTSLRAYINQTAPGLTTWETKTYKNLPYICIKAKTGGITSGKDEFKIFYAATPRLLIFSLSEDIIKRSLNRINLKKSDISQKYKPWLGKSFGLKINRSFLDILDVFYNINIRDNYKIKSWRNIFILNEWRKLNKNVSPTLFHKTYWKSRLFCPGGGVYVWNKEYQTMESSVFGFPGQSKKKVKFINPINNIESLEFGITFEGDGLRARGELIKKEK